MHYDQEYKFFLESVTCKQFTIPNYANYSVWHSVGGNCLQDFREKSNHVVLSLASVLFTIVSIFKGYKFMPAYSYLTVKSV